MSLWSSLKLDYQFLPNVCHKDGGIRCGSLTQSDSKVSAVQLSPTIIFLSLLAQVKTLGTEDTVQPLS